MKIARHDVLLTCLLLIAVSPSVGRGGEDVDQRPLKIGVEDAFPNLRIPRPVVLTHAGDGSRRIFVGTQFGVIHVFPKDRDVEQTEVFLDIRSQVVYEEIENEEGFLGLAFHPQYKQNGTFFVYYTTTEAPHTSVISRFRVSADDPDRADPASEEEILRIEQPYWNHNGGTLEFGPDGFLYIGLGDGGLSNDPLGHGQNLATLHGSILRIDVDRAEGDKNYAIPPDNPFVDRPGARPEIWAYGLRNVWRMAFDRRTGMLWAADNGEDLWEEIDIVQRGGNYGWSLREGRHKFVLQGSGPREDLIEPIWEYHHRVGMSIIGGCVYHGPRLPHARRSLSLRRLCRGVSVGTAVRRQAASGHGEPSHREQRPAGHDLWRRRGRRGVCHHDVGRRCHLLVQVAREGPAIGVTPDEDAWSGSALLFRAFLVAGAFRLHHGSSPRGFACERGGPCERVGGRR